MPIGRIYERDVDLLLAEEFEVSPEFASWFLGKTEKFASEEAIVVEVAVSKTDNLGESDLVVIFERTELNTRFALFIEDKIDAPLQPNQEARYRLRAQAGLERGLYSDFQVVLCSPTKYRETHLGTALFDAFVSYEDISAYLRSRNLKDQRSGYRANLLANCSTRATNSWERRIDSVTNLFWNAAYDLATKEFPDLEMKSPSFTKGQTWIDFRPREMPTQPRRVSVSLKGGMGLVDLTFAGILSRKFSPIVASLLETEMSVHQTGKSAVIRLRIQPFPVSEPDEAALSKLGEAFTACVQLIRFYRANRHTLDMAASRSLPDPVLPNFSIPTRPSEIDIWVNGSNDLRVNDADRSARSSETILEVGAEGGSLTLSQEVCGDGRMRFRVSTNEALFDDDGLIDYVAQAAKPRYTDSFPAAVALLDRYPWHELYPIKIHRDYYLNVLREVAKRGGKLAELRWRQTLAQQ